MLRGGHDRLDAGFGLASTRIGGVDTCAKGDTLSGTSNMAMGLCGAGMKDNLSMVCLRMLL